MKNNIFNIFLKSKRIEKLPTLYTIDRITLCVSMRLMWCRVNLHPTP